MAIGVFRDSQGVSTSHISSAIQIFIKYFSSLFSSDREGERHQVFFKSNQSRTLWVKSIGEQSAVAKAAPLGALTSQGIGGSSMTNSSGLGSSGSSKQFPNQNRIRAATTSAAVSSSGVPTTSQSLAGGSSRAAPFMRSDVSILKVQY